MPDGVLSMNGRQLWTLTGVEPVPEQVAAVRREAVRVLHFWAVDELSWAVELLLSELASNAVRHARTRYDVTMAWDRHTLRVAVQDADRAPPRPRLHVAQAETGGRGLLLVTDVAARWGWTPTANGKIVWFELAAPSTPPDVAALVVGVPLDREPDKPDSGGTAP